MARSNLPIQQATILLNINFLFGVWGAMTRDDGPGRTATSWPKVTNSKPNQAMLDKLFLHATVCEWRLHLEEHMLVRLVKHMENFHVRPLPDLAAGVLEENPKLLFRNVGWDKLCNPSLVSPGATSPHRSETVSPI